MQLDYKVTRQKLIEVFKLAGNVISVEMKEDKNGKFRGMGIVMFEQSLEAVQAVCILTSIYVSCFLQSGAWECALIF